MQASPGMHCTICNRVENRVVDLPVPPKSFGHAGVTINEHLFVFGGFADEVISRNQLLFFSLYRQRKTTVFC